jgi:hypothetical protein
MAGFTKGGGALYGGVYDGDSLWLVPHNADRIVKVDGATGALAGYVIAWLPSCWSRVGG